MHFARRERRGRTDLLENVIDGPTPIELWSPPASREQNGRAAPARAYEVSPSTGPSPAVAGSSRRPQCRIRWSGRVCTRGKTLLDANTGASPRRAIAGSRGREEERQRLRRRQRGSGVGRCLASRERNGARRAPCSATQSAAWRSLLGRPSSRSPRSTNQPDRVAAEVLGMRRPGLRVGPRLNGRSGTRTRPAPVAGGRSVA